MTKSHSVLPDAPTLVARCDEIQTSLGAKEVPEFETIPELGMAVRLALHIRGLALIEYQVLRAVANHYLGIPTLAVERIVRLLADVEFVRIQSEGNSIKGVLPTVPYYDDLYDRLGEYVTNERAFNEAEQLALHLVDRLAKAPDKIDTLRNSTGAEKKLFERNLDIGVKGSYLIKRRHRGRDIVLNPVYFSEKLSQALLTLLYGGRENYEHLNTLKKLIASSGPNVQNGKSLTLPEWDRFLQLVRHGLDSPIELPYAALLLRELAWTFLAEQPTLGFATVLSAEKRQAAKMALLGAEYISHAGKLPPEFAAIATKTLLGLQQPPSQPALSGVRI